MNRMMFRALMTLCLTFLASWAYGHNYHAVRTQIQLNPDSGVVEIIHRAFVNDLNQVVSQERKAHHELAETSEDELWVKGYWNRYFALLSDQELPLPISWVGMELDEHYLWVYQEYRGTPEQLSKALLHNGLLFGQFEHQINTVDLVLGEQKSALVFTQQQTRQPLTQSSAAEHHSHVH